MTLFIAGPLTFFLEKINRALGFQTVSGLKTDAQAQAVKEARAKANAFNQRPATSVSKPIDRYCGSLTFCQPCAIPPITFGMNLSQKLILISFASPLLAGSHLIFASM